MTRIISKYKSACLALALGCSLAMTTSCTDYLDKSPESDVSAEAAFKNSRISRALQRSFISVFLTSPRVTGTRPGTGVRMISQLWVSTI